MRFACLFVASWARRSKPESTGEHRAWRRASLGQYTNFVVSAPFCAVLGNCLAYRATLVHPPFDKYLLPCRHEPFGDFCQLAPGDATDPFDPLDRAFWVWLSRLWAEWRSALIIFKPETVIAWHRKGFRLYWAGRVVSAGAVHRHLVKSGISSGE